MMNLNLEEILIATEKKPNRKNRERSYTRYKRITSIRRKDNILKGILSSGYDSFRSHIPKGTLSKGKVHCSCYWCSPKTRTEGYKHSDKKRIHTEEGEIVFLWRIR